MVVCVFNCFPSPSVPGLRDLIAQYKRNRDDVLKLGCLFSQNVSTVRLKLTGAYFLAAHAAGLMIGYRSREFHIAWPCTDISQTSACAGAFAFQLILLF